MTQPDYWVEIRAAVRRTGPPLLVPLADVGNYRGFRSIVAYDAAVADIIRQQGGTSNLRNCPVYADTLFLDFDGHDPGQFRQWLQGSGLGYSEWDSGNRSVHFHIPMQPVFGSWVTNAMRHWVKRHAPTADTSFYHPAGMYRLPGTYHPKQPGRRKELVCGAEGNLLALEPVSQPQHITMPGASGTHEEFMVLLTQAVGEGHRRPRAWLLATMAAELGMSFEEALDHLLWWSARFCNPPHDADTIYRQCESAFQRLSRRHA